jgi:hypothetical protein
VDNDEFDTAVQDDQAEMGEMGEKRNGNGNGSKSVDPAESTTSTVIAKSGTTVTG